MKKLRKYILLSFLIIIILFIIYSIYYINDYYKAEEITKKYLTNSETVTVNINENIEFIPKNPKNKKIIIYPGGKVEFTAYSYLAYSLAEKGYYTVLIKMPLNLAIFGTNKANDYIKDNEDWVLIGHSLGGAMGARYIYNNPNKIKYLVLLGAYSVDDISDYDLKVLGIYGEKDKIAKKDKIIENSKFLPSLINYEIKGGNHSGFGLYGYQKGDGIADISNIQQQNIIINEVLEFIKE